MTIETPAAPRTVTTEDVITALTPDERDRRMGWISAVSLNGVGEKIVGKRFSDNSRWGGKTVAQEIGQHISMASLRKALKELTVEDGPVMLVSYDQAHTAGLNTRGWSTKRSGYVLRDVYLERLASRTAEDLEKRRAKLRAAAERAVLQLPLNLALVEEKYQELAATAGIES